MSKKPGSASDTHMTELHNLGNDQEEWVQVRVRKDLIPKGATLVEAYLTAKEVIVMGWPKEDDESHNCDAMGCGTLSHVLYRIPLPKPHTTNAPAPATFFCPECGKRCDYIRTRNLETCDVDVYICINPKCKSYGLYFYGAQRPASRGALLA